MQVPFLDISNKALMDPMASAWKGVASQDFELYQTPLGMVEHLSPFMALSEDHGSVNKVRARLVHNGKKISIHLAWKDKTADDAIRDLDQFVDGIAIMFPLSDEANAMTMGDERNPVNIWFWKADRPEAFDVIAHGFGTSRKRPGAETGLKVEAHHDGTSWNVVFQRALRDSLFSSGHVNFAPPGILGRSQKSLGISLAVWDGSNKERSGQKSISGEWEPIEIEA